MKSRLFFSLLFLIISSIGFSQQVTLDDLMKEESASKRNSKKKWVEALSVLNNRDSSLMVLKTEFSRLEKSGNWILNEETPQNLSYQTIKKMYVDRFILDIKSAGYTLSNSKQTEDSRTLIYSKNDSQIEVMAYTLEANSSTIFLVSLLK